MMKFLYKVVRFLIKCLFCVVSVGPIPSHIAFVMDGNRRFAKQRNMKVGAGHEAGYSALMSMLIHCSELGVKYVTAYAFSIDNFKRRPEEVECLVDLMTEKFESLCREDSIVNRFGIRVHFSGSLQLLSGSLRDAAKKLTAATVGNSGVLLTLCVAYTSTDEIVRAVEKSCEEGSSVISLSDIEKRMYMVIAPDPDILIRSSGENRLSNFLLWQSAGSCLVSTSVMWPEISFWHLIWAVLNFQRYQSLLKKKKKL
ncbi:hypothetical protein V6N13_102629 [Hibiscus sabdariffa]|uniref:Alkyl transferase n=1 Tax=Hibiscus sabdariffa TaxID=183260 RepID=A0ABR2D4L6_9ROSI